MLFKCSDVEAGVKWWFLYEIPEEGVLRGVLRFLKRFGSEEELEVEAMAKYGAVPVCADPPGPR